MIDRHFGNDEYSFMDDNATVHRAITVNTYKENKLINETEWPAQSPDTNIIENIWVWRKRDIENQTLSMTTSQQQFDIISGVWKNIPVDYATGLYGSIPG